MSSHWVVFCSFEHSLGLRGKPRYPRTTIFQYHHCYYCKNTTETWKQISYRSSVHSFSRSSFITIKCLLRARLGERLHWWKWATCLGKSQNCAPSKVMLLWLSVAGGQRDGKGLSRLNGKGLSKLNTGAKEFLVKQVKVKQGFEGNRIKQIVKCWEVFQAQKTVPVRF